MFRTRGKIYLMSSFYYIINLLPSHLSLILRVQIPSDAGLSLAPRGFSCSKEVCERCWRSEGKIFNIVILLHNRCSVHLSLILRVQIPSDAVSVFGTQMVLVLKGSLCKVLGSVGKIFKVIVLPHLKSLSVVPLGNYQSGNCRRGCFCVWHPEGPHAQKQSMRGAGLSDVLLFLLFLHFLQKIQKLLYSYNLSYNSNILPFNSSIKKELHF